MAPEVLRNKDLPIDQKGSYGIAVDRWALGYLLFELRSHALFKSADDVLAYVARTLTPLPEQPYAKFESSLLSFFCKSDLQPVIP
ncbi:hypothetical protein JVU11DRAFT_9860 [Chiua virens]|nr:hypothetical protein JVU11DRAFT_9860 [Chiua virens]